MAKTHLKSKAISLRKKGFSIGEISLKLNISRSTASVWCSSIILTEKQKNKLYQNMVSAGSIGRQKGAYQNHLKKLEQQNRARFEASLNIGELTDRDILMQFLGLYWGEGSKNSERKFVFTNSDVKSVQLVAKALFLLGVSKEDLVMSIYINSTHKGRIKIIEEYWLKSLSIKKSQMRKTVLVQTISKKVYLNKNEYYGVSRLTVKKSSKLKDYVIASLEYIKSFLN